ncbi:MAG TPA: site-specific integrase [Paenibacillus sp.]|uniref:tyrosine-type recombinase/integrase n=1 Tax=Paenibacillus TaxID=44249 RepID=UPI000BA089D2|nr:MULTISPECIES: tyrosine-type recombinase/integrase [Paenibacillus]OZQ64322.1 site-specific integrase [Paenibacillus taichungensis]HBU81712.1 site-specific integrase [Paenibacillus sp.]
MASYTKIKANNKQGYKWICTLEGPTDPVTGKRKQIPRRGDTQKEAFAKAQKALDELTEHNLDSRSLSKLSFEEVAQDWLKYYSKTNVKNRTIRTRFQEIKILLKYYGKVSINKVTFKLHQDMLYDLDDKGYSSSTIKGVNVTANMIMKYAMKHKWRLDNPFLEATIPSKPLTVEEIENDPIIEKILEKDELAEFLLAVKEHGEFMDNVIFHLLAFSGMRSGELCSLKDSDFFFDTNEIRITKTIDFPKNNMRNYFLTPPKTKGSVRRVDIIQEVMDAAEAHIDLMKRQRLINKKLYDDYHNETFLFANENGYPLSPRNILMRMKKILKQTNIKKKATPHIFRHTHVSMLAEAEVDLKTIMERVGHDDAKTTLKVYTHVTKKMKKNANEKIRLHYSSIIQL